MEAKMAFYITNILCIAIIIAVHEYGHFFFARRYGLRPPKFAVGFGSELVGFDHDGTRFSLRLIPLGGFVEISPESMEGLSRWQRIKISAGGSLANMLLCVIVGMVYAVFGTIPEDLADVSTLWLVLVAAIGSMLLFIVAIPLSIYALADILLNPIENLDMVDGPIGVISGRAVPAEILTSTTLLDQAMIVTWVLSFSIGTINLVPLSLLDGGRIFSEAFAKFPAFVKGWNVVTSGILAVLIIYLIGGDIYKLF